MFVGLLLPGFLICSGCRDFMTDAATRVAFEIETEAEALAQSTEKTRTFLHHPKRRPAGCADVYTMTLHGNGTLSVHCLERTNAYSTTYHRRFVHAPRALSVSHAGGEATRITLQKSGSQIALIALE